MTDHREIWLNCKCSEGHGREWCQDPVFARCEECGAEPVKYIRADLACLLDKPEAVETVGEAGEMPGSNGGFTMAVFKASDVPLGTKLYTRPADTDAAQSVEVLIARLQQIHDEQHSILGQMLLDKSEEGQSASNWQGGKVNGISSAISALSTPADTAAAQSGGEIEVTENMRVAACRVLNERGKGNNVTICDVVAMLEAAIKESQ
ncbi:hypothetical protein GOD68_18040 [Sinorhizobium medicae]|nr:hypothetical protein [Sinorhizobium medicae]